MEARKITIISTRDNKRTVINTDATTLGELKKALREAGVDYAGMTFYEGLTKTELKLDESILPHDVQRISPVTREPETTNELAFMLTNTNKKIKSGAMSRMEVYAAIKAGGLQAECFKAFGKNFTVCKTADLISFLKGKSASKPSATSKPVDSATPSAPTESVTVMCAQSREAIKRLVDVLCNYCVMGDGDRNHILEPLGYTNVATISTGDGASSPYSDDELDAMFENMPL